MNQKQTGVSSREGPLSRASLRPPNYFVNSICSPSIRAASGRYQQVLFFSAYSAAISSALPFFSLMRASIFPMLRLRGRFKPFDAEPCARLNRWRPPTAGLIGPADLILPSSVPSFTLIIERRFTTCALRVFSCAQLGGFSEHISELALATSFVKHVATFQRKILASVIFYLESLIKK
jgi:hypothetical protein